MLELQSYFRAATPGQRLRAVPGAGLNVPLYLLGSSDFSAQLAAELGLPFAFASHFAPEYLHVALKIYREQFRPSGQLAQPYAIVGVGLFAAETDAAAEALATSAQLMFLNLVRGEPGQLPAPVTSMDGRWSMAERAAVRERMRYSLIGSAETIRGRLGEILAETQADEIIANGQIHDHTARVRSFEIAARVFAELI